MPTSDPAANPAPAQPPNHAGRLRLVALVLLLLAIAAAVSLLLLTARGHELMQNPKLFRPTIEQFVDHHLFIAPLLYMAAYIVLGVLALPVWWLQVIGGIGFGLVGAVALSQIASSISAVLAARFAHWLTADWMHRLEERRQQLKKLDDAFGHNGLLVVMATRLTHVLPFGLSNYVFGLTSVPMRDIFWGTLLGGLPAVSIYAAIGIGDKPLADWRYILGIVALNILLLIPLAVHYFWKRQ